jgi:hypothetical protein
MNKFSIILVKSRVLRVGVSKLDDNVNFFGFNEKIKHLI